MIRWIQDLLPTEIILARTSKNPRKNASMASAAQAKPVARERREALMEGAPADVPKAGNLQEVTTQVPSMVRAAGVAEGGE